MQLAFHFGRTSGLSEQELLSVASTLPFAWTTHRVSGELLVLKPTGNEAAVAWSSINPSRLKAAQELAGPLQDRLGGTIRIMWLDNAPVGRADLVEFLAQLAEMMRESAVPGARSVGVSIWGNVDVHKFGIKLKRELKERGGWSVRIVLPREGGQLTPAQVAGERLAFVPRSSASKGVEVVAIEHQGAWLVGVTLTASNIDFYSQRDFGIPKPDAVSGMLPPKLAQMMVNLAVGPGRPHVHDPFCGNGRVVLEAALMGLPCSGSDIEEGKVLAAQENLRWESDIAGLSISNDQFWTGDATDPGNRENIIHKANGPFVLVGEPYLGRPLRAPLRNNEQAAWLSELVGLYNSYIECWSKASRQPDNQILIMPRAKVEDGSEIAVYNAVVDRFNQVGYSAEVLFCYDRPDSIVRRDIVCIKKNH